MRFTDKVEIFSEPTHRHLKLAIINANVQAHQRGEEVKEIHFSTTTITGANKPTYSALLIIGTPDNKESEL